MATHPAPAAHKPTAPVVKPPAKPVVKMVRVRALERGYDNVAVREPGDEFDMPEGASGPWFEPVEASE